MLTEMIAYHNMQMTHDTQMAIEDETDCLEHSESPNEQKTIDSKIEIISP